MCRWFNWRQNLDLEYVGATRVHDNMPTKRNAAPVDFDFPVPCSCQSACLESNKHNCRVIRKIMQLLSVAHLIYILLTEPAKLVCSALNSVDQKGASLEDGVLEALRELVGQLGGDVEDADDMELMRFLKARSMDLEVAAEAFITHKKWRSENVPNGKFTEADLPTELDAKKLYWIPQDIKGRPVLLTLGRNHVYNKQDFDEFTRVLVYALDKSIARAPPTTQNFLAIVDLKGLGVKNLDSKSFIAAFELVEKHYPDRIDKIFMINVPFIFNGLWKVVSRFIDEGTKSKIIFVDNKKLTETLLTEIELEYLPAEYGGKADLLLLQDA